MMLHLSFFLLLLTLLGAVQPQLHRTNKLSLVMGDNSHLGNASSVLSGFKTIINVAFDGESNLPTTLKPYGTSTVTSGDDASFDTVTVVKSISISLTATDPDHAAEPVNMIYDGTSEFLVTVTHDASMFVRDANMALKSIVDSDSITTTTTATSYQSSTIIAQVSLATTTLTNYETPIVTTITSIISPAWLMTITAPVTATTTTLDGTTINTENVTVATTTFNGTSTTTTTMPQSTSLLYTPVVIMPASAATRRGLDDKETIGVVLVVIVVMAAAMCVVVQLWG